MINIFKTNPDVKTPTRATEGSAGFDLYSESAINIPAGESRMINTGIILEMSPNVCGQIWPRSGLASKFRLDVLGGVIDSDYRGEVKVLLINHDSTAYQVNYGDKIAQILFVPVVTSINVGGKLTETERGDGGFGSTGR